VSYKQREGDGIVPRGPNRRGPMARMTITDLAIKNGSTYRATHERALRGDYGPVSREGSRLYVIVTEPNEGDSGPDR